MYMHRLGSIIMVLDFDNML